MLYHQITVEERYTVGLLRQQGLSRAAIARLLGRHRCTIGREVRRNGTPRDGCYRPQLAEWYARGRRSRSRRNRRFSPLTGPWFKSCSAKIGAPIRWPGGCAGSACSGSATKPSIATSGLRSRRAARFISICAARASSAASATGATIAAGA